MLELPIEATIPTMPSELPLEDDIPTIPLLGFPPIKTIPTMPSFMSVEEGKSRERMREGRQASTM
jgi:hypothetical protein